jgi:cell division protein FtsW
VSPVSAGTGLGQPGGGRAGGEDAAGEAGEPQAAARPGLGAALDRADSLRDGLLRVKALLDRPLASYYLILGCSLLLLGVGLMMVLSTSTAYDLDQGLAAYSTFQKQLLGAGGGLVLMWLAAKAPPRAFRACVYPLLIISILGLLMVLAVGVTSNGAARWVDIAGIQVQPSEFAKLGLLLWGADLLARKEKLGQLNDPRQLLVPLLPGTAIFCLLVMAGKDLGTTFLIIVIFLTLLWVIGTPARILVGMVGLMLLVLLMLIVVEPYRLTRLLSFFATGSGSCGSQSGFQLCAGKDALGSGGLFGVGAGASRMKWGSVPNSESDFIFAILGEELGLVGTACVVFLYAGIAFAGLRIARRVPDTFSRLAASAITVWIIVQALVNIGAVLGVLPITGVPLPLISAGVSSLVVTMAALGMLMAFARSEPGAAEAIAAVGPGAQRRLLHWLGLGRGPH